ncbi:MAG: histone deacetylase, partial [Alphaproteobacteria bacterium]|nr:histone deacetylase [Alphaproteobacteria bacterium]
MKVVHSDTHESHNPKTYFKGGGFFEPQEVPARVEALLDAVISAGHQIVTPADHGPAPRAAVHTPEYLTFLETIYDRWKAMGSDSDEVLPNIHPGRHMSSMPTGVVGQVGYFTADLSAPIGVGTWEAACGAANTAVHATQLMIEGEKTVYA